MRLVYEQQATGARFLALQYFIASLTAYTAHLQHESSVSIDVPLMFYETRAHQACVFQGSPYGVCVPGIRNAHHHLAHTGPQEAVTQRKRPLLARAGRFRFRRWCLFWYCLRRRRGWCRAVSGLTFFLSPLELHGWPQIGQAAEVLVEVHEGRVLGLVGVSDSSGACIGRHSKASAAEPMRQRWNCQPLPVSCAQLI